MMYLMTTEDGAERTATAGGFDGAIERGVQS